MEGIRRQDRARSLAVVLAVHGLALWLALAFAHTRFVRAADTIVSTFDVRPVEPPPPQIPPPARRPGQDRAKAATRLAVRPTPVTAPSVVVSAVSPVLAVAAPEPAAALSGAAGDGIGVGAGNGVGSTGSGFGGLEEPARLRSGRIEPRDYPRAAGGAQGNVSAHLTIGADGRVTGCSVTRSSGNTALDATTCRLIRERFVFNPARNARGEAVPSEYSWQQRWWRD